MNEHEIDRIASAFHVLRPDWPHASLRTFIAKNLATRPRRDVCVALAWVACESNTATPARVLEAGPWWKAAGMEGGLTPRPPKLAEACRTCGRAMHAPDAVCAEPSERPLPKNDPADTSARVAALRSNVVPMRAKTDPSDPTEGDAS